MRRVLIITLIFELLLMESALASQLCSQVLDNKLLRIELEMRDLFQQRVQAIQNGDAILSKIITRQIEAKDAEIRQAGFRLSRFQKDEREKPSERIFQEGDKSLETDSQSNRIQKSLIHLEKNFDRLFKEDDQSILIDVEGQKVEQRLSYNFREAKISQAPTGASKWVRHLNFDVIERNGRAEIIDILTGRVHQFEQGWELLGSQASPWHIRLTLAETPVREKTLFFDLNTQQVTEMSSRVLEASRDLSFRIVPTGFIGNTVRFHFVDKESPLAKIEAHHSDYKFAPDLDMLAVRNNSKTELYDTKTGLLRAQLPEAQDMNILDNRYLQLTLHPRIAGIKTVQIYDMQSGVFVVELNNPLFVDRTTLVDTKVFGPGTVAVFNENRLRIINLADQKELATLITEGTPIFASKYVLITMNSAKLSVYSISQAKYLLKDVAPYALRIPVTRTGERNDNYLVSITWHGNGALNTKSSHFWNLKTGNKKTITGDFDVEMIGNGKKFVITSKKKSEIYVIDERDIDLIDSIVVQ